VFLSRPFWRRNFASLEQGLRDLRSRSILSGMKMRVLSG
jgi:hypothetical protein